MLLLFFCPNIILTKLVCFSFLVIFYRTGGSLVLLNNFFIQPASEASGLAEGQRARFAREAATRFYPPPTPSGAVGHNPKSGSGQFLGRTSLEMRFTRVGVKSKIGHTTRVDAYVCLTLHAGRVKRVKCVKRAILGKIREWHFLAEAPLNSP